MSELSRISLLRYFQVVLHRKGPSAHQRADFIPNHSGPRLTALNCNVLSRIRPRPGVDDFLDYSGLGLWVPRPDPEGS